MAGTARRKQNTTTPPQKRDRSDRTLAARQARRTLSELAAATRAARTASWGALAPRRRQRLAMFLRALREAAGESMQQVGIAAAAEGMLLSSRLLVNLESMVSYEKAVKRYWVNMETVAWLLARYGVSLQEMWTYVTAEERPGELDRVSAAQSAGQELAAAYDVLPASMQQQLLAFAHTLVSAAGVARAAGMMPQASALVDAETASRYEAVRALDAVKASEELHAAAAEADAEAEREKRRRAN